MNKKQFFKREIQKATYSIWDMEFRISKARQLREGIRLDRDVALDNASNADVRAKDEGLDKETREKAAQEAALLRENATRFEKQIDMIDREINGFMGDEENPSIIGLLEKLKSMTELREMYKDYVSKI